MTANISGYTVRGIWLHTIKNCSEKVTLFEAMIMVVFNLLRVLLGLLRFNSFTSPNSFSLYHDCFTLAIIIALLITFANCLTRISFGEC